MSLSGEDLQTKKKPLNRNTTTGTSDDNELQIRNSFGDKSNRYGDPKIDTQGFKLIGSRVKQLQHVVGGMTPIDSQIRPCITSHENPRGIKYASSAASYYDVSSPLKKISPSQATKTNRGSVKSSGVFTQNLDSERPKNEKTEFSKRSSKSKEIQGSENLAKMRSPSPIKLDKITSLAREVPPQRSLSQDEQETRQVQKASKPAKPIKRYPQQVFQLLSILRNQNPNQASKKRKQNVDEPQEVINYVVKQVSAPGDQAEAEDQNFLVQGRKSLLLNENFSDTQRRKSLDAVSNSNIKNRKTEYQTQPIDIRAIRSQMHLSAKTDEDPREGTQFPEDAVLALVPYVGPNGEIKETAVMLRESSGINNGQASTLVRNDPSSAFGQRSNSMQERPDVVINADIQELIPYVSIRKHVSNAQQTDGDLKPDEDSQHELNQNLPEQEFFTANAAEEQELFNYFEFRQRQKLAKSSNPFFNVQRKSQSRAGSVDRQNAGSQLATRKRQNLNERKEQQDKQANRASGQVSKHGTKQARSPNPNALVQGVRQQLQPSPSPDKVTEPANKKGNLAPTSNQGGIKCHVEKKHSVQDKMIRINKDEETKSVQSKSMCETEKGAQTRSNNRVEEIRIIQDNQAQPLDQELSVEQAQEDAFITSVSISAPKSNEEVMNQKKQAKDMDFSKPPKLANQEQQRTKPTPTISKIQKNTRQKEALEKLKKRQQLEVEKDDVGKIILPVNSWEYRLKMTKNIGKKSLAAIKSRTQAPQTQLKQPTIPILSQLPSIRTDPTEDSGEIIQNLTNQQMFTHKSSEGRLGRRTVLQQHVQLSSGDDRQSIQNGLSNQATFISDQVLAEEGIVALPSNFEIQNNHEMAIFEESLISENFHKEEAAAALKNQQEKIFKDSWKINQIGQNFESSLYKEVLYLKEMKQRYDKNTNGQRLPNAVLDKEKLISTTKIPNIIGETNKGTIMKNRRPAKQSRSFSLSQLNMRQISRRQEKRTGRNQEAYQNSYLPNFVQKHVSQPKVYSSVISSQNSQDLLQIEAGQGSEAQIGPYAITAQGSQIQGSETHLTTGNTHMSTGNIPHPKRSQFSRLNSMGYKCDVIPDCDIKALRSKNLGSVHDPDPTSLLKLRFKKKDYRDKTSTFSQGGPTTREGPSGSRRFGSGSFNETGFMSVTTSHAQHQRIVPHPDHVRIYSQTRQMTRRAHGHFKKYLNQI